jgi:hypothetical protein
MELHLLFLYAMAEAARMCTSVHSDVKLQRLIAFQNFAIYKQNNNKQARKGFRPPSAM